MVDAMCVNHPETFPALTPACGKNHLPQNGPLVPKRWVTAVWSAALQL